MSAISLISEAAELPDDLIVTLVKLLDEAEATIGRHPDIAGDHIRAAHSLLIHRSGDMEEIQRVSTPAMGRLAPWQEARIKTFIGTSLQTRVDSTMLAQVVQLSTGHFIRAFKASFGMSPHSYIAQERITAAQGLMLQSDTSLAEIALMCGLSDQAHFCHVFRRKVGMTPTAWRKRQAAATDPTRAGSPPDNRNFMLAGNETPLVVVDS